MTIAALFLLAAAALLPLLLALRRPTPGRGRREAALALHREQLAELERDRAEGRISPAEHAAAQLEVQRRLLAADALAGHDPGRGPVAGHGPMAGGRALLLVLGAVPVAAFALYAIQGRPFLPGAPMAARLAEADRNGHQAVILVAMLRARLDQPGLEPQRRREGFVLLGNAEDSLGHLAQAAQAWREAVRLRFDPDLAALAAEAQTRVDGGRVSADSAALFAQALAQAPADAPWRAMAQARLQGTAPRP